MITAVVPGATVTSTDIDIVDADGDSVCQTVTVVDYGVVECLTITGAIAASTQLSVTQDDVTYECMSTDTAVCAYEQLDDGGYPAVSSTAISGNTIVFTGTGFDFSTDFSGIA